MLIVCLVLVCRDTINLMYFVCYSNALIALMDRRISNMSVERCLSVRNYLFFKFLVKRTMAVQVKLMNWMRHLYWSSKL